MRYKQIIEYSIGKHGIDQNELDGLLSQSTDHVTTSAAHPNVAALLESARRQDDIQDILTLADAITKKFNHVVIIGTGGSSLSSRVFTDYIALQRTLEQASPTLHYMENVDPHSASSLLQCLPLEDACFIAISKSGGTTETLASLALCLEALGSAEAISKQCYLISDPGDNNLRRIGQQFSLNVLDHDPGIGGRFAAFTNVGLLPAALAGLDIRAIRQGAVEVIEHSFNTSGETAMPVMGAAMQTALIRNGIAANICMPYADQLTGFAALYRQIWAESLGKDGLGNTPVTAIGTIDQHSQLQLYLDGPKDKYFTLIRVDETDEHTMLSPEFLAVDSLDYLHHHSLRDVMSASCNATYETLAKRQCPVRLWQINTLDEATLGALVMHVMLETIFTAAYLGINAFDQPAVEDGKILTKKFLKEANKP